MKKKLLISLFIAIVCFTLVGCGKTENTENDTKLNDVYNKVGSYFGNENADNLGAYYLDTEKNVVVVVLVDNSKEKQESFKKLAKIDDYSEYLKFVQGGPNYPLNNGKAD